MQGSESASIGLVVSARPNEALAELGPLVSGARPELVIRTTPLDEAWQRAIDPRVSVVLVDGRAPGAEVCSSLREMRRATPAPIVVVLAPGQDCFEEALVCGADELCTPDAAAIAVAVARALARRRAAAQLEQALEQKQEEQRQRRLRSHNELLRTLGKQLVTHDLAQQLGAITEAAARSMDVARVGVWLFDPEHRRIRAEDIYDTRTGKHESGLELTAIAFPEYFSALEEERVIAASDAHGHPATRGFSSGYLAQHGIASLLDAPIRVGGRVLGVLCHEHVGKRREFTDEDHSVAGSLADFVALAIESHEHGRAESALISSNKQLEEARRIEAVGRLAGGVAHDFNNVITVVSSYAFLLAKKLDKHDPLQGPVAEIGKAAERAADITRKLLALTRRDPAAPRVFDLNLVVRGMEMFLRRLIGEHIVLSIELSAEPVMLRADPGQIEQIILNLGINARDAAAPEGGSIVIRTRKETAKRKNAKKMPCVLEVEDKGVGMSAEVKARIFEPFFTTKDIGRGSGLGLFTVWGAVDQMGATIEVKSAPMQGSCFTIRFAEAPPAEQSLARPSDKSALLGTERVLLVEDEPQVREVTTLILRDLGYGVFAASNIDEALDLARREKTFDLLVSDIVMPRASGPVVAARLRELLPKLKVLFITGYSKEMLSGYDSSLGPTLPKPFTAEQIGKKVRQILDGKDSNASRVA